MDAGVDNGHIVLHFCWRAGRADGYEPVLCCGRDTFGKHSQHLKLLHTWINSLHMVLASSATVKVLKASASA